MGEISRDYLGEKERNLVTVVDQLNLFSNKGKALQLNRVFCLLILTLIIFILIVFAS